MELKLLFWNLGGYGKYSYKESPWVFKSIVYADAEWDILLMVEVGKHPKFITDDEELKKKYKWKFHEVRDRTGNISTKNYLTGLKPQGRAHTYRTRPDELNSVTHSNNKETDLVRPVINFTYQGLNIWYGHLNSGQSDQKSGLAQTTMVNVVEEMVMEDHSVFVADMNIIKGKAEERLAEERKKNNILNVKIVVNAYEFTRGNVKAKENNVGEKKELLLWQLRDANKPPSPYTTRATENSGQVTAPRATEKRGQVTDSIAIDSMATDSRKRNRQSQSGSRKKMKTNDTLLIHSEDTDEPEGFGEDLTGQHDHGNLLDFMIANEEDDFMVEPLPIYSRISKRKVQVTTNNWPFYLFDHLPIAYKITLPDS